jgi:hypothetical protein
MTWRPFAGITLVFPTSVDAQSGGFMSMDWIAGRMRYQLDRKFKKAREREHASARAARACRTARLFRAQAAACSRLGTAAM